MYEFGRNCRAARSGIVHFQLRQLVWAPSADSVFLGQESAVVHWRPSARRLRRAVDLRGSPSGPAMPGGVVGRVAVSTVCARHGLVAAGGFAGELVVVREDGGGLVARRARAAAAAAGERWSLGPGRGGGGGSDVEEEERVREWWRPSEDGWGNEDEEEDDEDEDEEEEDDDGGEGESEGARRRRHRHQRQRQRPPPPPLPPVLPPAAAAGPEAAAAAAAAAPTRPLLLHLPAVAQPPFCSATFHAAAERARRKALASGCGPAEAAAAAAEAAAGAGGWDWWDEYGEGEGGPSAAAGGTDNDDEPDEDAAAAAADARAGLLPRLLPRRPRPFYLRPGLTPQGGPPDRPAAAAAARPPPPPRAAAAARASAYAHAALSGRRADGRPALPRGLVYSGRVTRSENGITNALEVYASSSSGLAVAASNNDAFVRVFDAPSGFRERARFAFDYAVNCTAARPLQAAASSSSSSSSPSSAAPPGHSPVLAVVGDHPDAVLVDERAGQHPVARFVGHLDYSFAVAWHPGGHLLATGNQDTCAMMWDARFSGKGPLARLGARMGAVRSTRFSPCGRFLAAAEPADFVHLYDVRQVAGEAAALGEASSFYLPPAGAAGEGAGEGAGAGAAGQAPPPPTRRRFWGQTLDFFGEISGVAFSPDSRSLYVGIADQTYSSLAHYTLARNDDEEEEDGEGDEEAAAPWRPAPDVEARRARAARRRRCAGVEEW